MTEHPPFISQQVRKSAYYFFDLNPEATAGMRVVCGGWEACLPAYRIDREDFPYYSLEYVFAGQGWLRLAGRSFRLIPGTIFHYGPGIPHQIESSPDAPLEKYFVDFVGTSAREILNEAPFSELQPLHLASPGPVGRLFDELNASGASKSLRAVRLCSVLAELLLLRLAETAAPLDHEGSVAWSTYERCRRHIHEHYLSLRTLDEVSTGCGVDKAYLCRLFKRFGGETPYQLLTRLKMDHAAELLLQSNLLIKEVAEAVRFDDPYHFSHVFKRVRGLSPTEFTHLAHHRLGM